MERFITTAIITASVRYARVIARKMLNQKSLTLTWLDSDSENPMGFPYNGIIAKPFCFIITNY